MLQKTRKLTGFINNNFTFNLISFIFNKIYINLSLLPASQQSVTLDHAEDIYPFLLML